MNATGDEPHINDDSRDSDSHGSTQHLHPENLLRRKKERSYIPGSFNISGGFTILGDVYGNDLEGLYLATIRAEIAQALSYHSIDARRQAIVTVDKGAFDWVWSSGFESWLSNATKLFWITGKPGSGKSTLMRHLAESNTTKILLESRNNIKWNILHFYFDFSSDDDLANTPEGMLRSWILQIAIYSPKSITSTPQSLTQSAMVDVIVEVLQSEDKRYCIFVDGLDEYRGDMSELLSLLMSVEHRTTAKMCLASRTLPDIELHLKEYADGYLFMQDWNYQSIHKYLSAVNNSVAATLRAPCPVEILNEIARRADGVILWAKLALENILQGCSKGQTLHELKNRLDDLPSEIEGLYSRAMGKIEIELHFEAKLYLMAIESLGPLSAADLKAILITAADIPPQASESSAVKRLVGSSFIKETLQEHAAAVHRLSQLQYEYRIRALCGGLLVTDDTRHSTAKVLLLNAFHRLINWLLPAEGQYATDLWYSSTRFRLVHETLQTYVRRILKHDRDESSVLFAFDVQADRTLMEYLLIKDVLKDFASARQLRARWLANAEFYMRWILFLVYTSIGVWLGTIFVVGPFFFGETEQSTEDWSARGAYYGKLELLSLIFDYLTVLLTLLLVILSYLVISEASGLVLNDLDIHEVNTVGKTPKKTKVDKNLPDNLQRDMISQSGSQQRGEDTTRLKDSRRETAKRTFKRFGSSFKKAFEARKESREDEGSPSERSKLAT